MISTILSAAGPTASSEIAPKGIRDVVSHPGSILKCWRRPPAGSVMPEAAKSIPLWPDSVERRACHLRTDLGSAGAAFPHRAWPACDLRSARCSVRMGRSFQFPHKVVVAVFELAGEVGFREDADPFDEIVKLRAGKGIDDG